MSVTLKEYRFFRSFSTKIENWPMRKAEALWRKMRERKIAGTLLMFFDFSEFGCFCVVIVAAITDRLFVSGAFEVRNATHLLILRLKL